MRNRMPRMFTLTEDHIKLLRRAYVDWDDGEYGAPAIDCKRPYGNSSVDCDVAEILGWAVDEDDGPTQAHRDAAAKVHAETQTALQIILATGAMVAGEYVRSEEYNARSWQAVDASPSEPTGAWDVDDLTNIAIKAYNEDIASDGEQMLKGRLPYKSAMRKAVEAVLASAPPAGDGVPRVRPDDVEYVKGCAERAQAWLEKQGAMVVPEDITLRDRLVRLTAALSYCATRQGEER